MFVSCSSAHSWFSVIPGASAASIRLMPASATRRDQRMHSISPSHLTDRARSTRSTASTTSSPACISAPVMLGLTYSTATRRSEAPMPARKSVTSRARARASSFRFPPALKKLTARAGRTSSKRPAAVRLAPCMITRPSAATNA